MTAIQIAAVLSLLLAFGVPSPTVEVVRGILTPQIVTSQTINNPITPVADPVPVNPYTSYIPQWRYDLVQNLDLLTVETCEMNVTTCINSAKEITTKAKYLIGANLPVSDALMLADKVKGVQSTLQNAQIGLLSTGTSAIARSNASRLGGVVDSLAAVQSILVLRRW